MSIVLVVDADESARAAVRTELTEEGCEVFEAGSVEQALAWLQAGPIDVVVASTRLPDGNAPSLRTRAHASLAPPFVPFVFLADSADLDSGAFGSDDAIITTPIDPSELAGAVRHAVASNSRLEGRCADGSLDALFADVETSAQSGVLVVYHGTQVKKALFDAGAVVFCASNDPRELLGQRLVKAGLITQRELAEAMDIHREGAEPLGNVLQAMSKLTAAQTNDVVAKKFVEALADVYLWADGCWIYRRGAVPQSGPRTVRVEVAAVRSEGQRRARAWPELVRLVPDSAMTFTVEANRVPDKWRTSPGRRRVVELLSAGRTVAQLCTELRSHEFPIYVGLASLLNAKAIAPAAAANAPPAARATHSRDQAIPLRRVLEVATQALTAGRLDDAEHAFDDVLRLHATNVHARRGLQLIEQRRVAAAAEAGVDDSLRVELAVPLESLMSKDLSAAEAFVLTRLTGQALSVAELVTICPLPRAEVVAVVERHLEQRTLCAVS